MWVKWVNCVYLKGMDWWQYNTPQDSCWYWKKLCELKTKYAFGYVQNGWLKREGKYSIETGYMWRRGHGKEWPSGEGYGIPVVSLSTNSYVGQLCMEDY